MSRVLRLNSLPYVTDRGLGQRARIGLVALASDYTVEHDFRTAFGWVDDAEVYTARCRGRPGGSSEPLIAYADRIADTAALLLPGERLNAVAFACGASDILLGEDLVEAEIRSVRPRVPVTTPMVAARAAMRACGIGKIGVLTPYRTEFNVRFESLLDEAGVEVSVIGSLDEERDSVVSSISEDAIRHNVLALAEAAPIDGFYIADTQLRSLHVVRELEREIGVPVIGANHALIWHSLRLAGIDDEIRGFGLLYGLTL